MADEVRLIDANSVCKKIVESIRCAEKWQNEAKEQQDTHGLRCATEAKTSLLAMLARIHDEPIIEVEPDNGWISVKDRLPPTGVPVLIYVYNIEEMTVVSLDHDGLGFSNADEWFNIKNIHHWQHLPEPPKGDVEIARIDK